MPINSESTPPPLIGKIGPYTVFMTPPATPSPASPPQPVFESPKKVIQPPPVQPPPQQFDKSVAVAAVPNGNASVAGFFRNAVSKVQNGNTYDGMFCSGKWVSALSLFVCFIWTNVVIFGGRETEMGLGFFCFCWLWLRETYLRKIYLGKSMSSLIMEFHYFLVCRNRGFGIVLEFSHIAWCVIRPGFSWNIYIFLLVAAIIAKRRDMLMNVCLFFSLNYLVNFLFNILVFCIWYFKVGFLIKFGGGTLLEFVLNVCSFVRKSSVLVLEIGGKKRTKN